MRRLLVLLALSCVFLVSPARAQLSYELPCPTGTNVLPQGRSFDPTTGKWRAFLCINSQTGQVTYNDAVNSLSISVENLNNIQWVTTSTPGADLCAKIATKIAALPATGGVVSATGMQGAQTCSANPFSSTTAVDLWLGNSTIVVSNGAGWVVPNSSHVRGLGRSASGLGGTVLQAASGFTGSLIKIGNFAVTGKVFDSWVSDLYLDCNTQTGCTGLSSDAANEKSGAFDVLIGNVTTAPGLNFSGGSNNTNYFLKDTEVVAAASAPAGTVPVQLTGIGYVTHLSVVRNGAGSVTNAITLDGFTGSLRDIHVESATNGILIGGTTASAAVLLDTLTGNTNVTNLVHISNATNSSSISIINWHAEGGTPSIVDDLTGKTVADGQGVLYLLGPAGGGDYVFVATTALETGKQLKSVIATGTAPLAITSTTPVANLTVSNHPQVEGCGTTTSCSATAITGGRVVFGTAALSSGTPSTATVTGIAGFTSSTSFRCTVSNNTTQANPLKVVNASVSSITVTGPASVTDSFTYICAGN